MIIDLQFLRKWVLYPVMLGWVAGMAIACQPDSSPGVSSPSASSNASPEQSSPAPSAESPPSETSTPELAPADQALYQNNTYGFQFSYSTSEFVLDEAKSLSSEDGGQIKMIKIWTHKDDQDIQSGVYESSEYPPHVSVSARNNPQQLSLREWIEQSNWFVLTRDFRDVTVAGQDAITFQSSGLYDFEVLVFGSPDGSNIIVISLAQTGYGDDDTRYQKAFEQVVNSFTFADE